jgi:hypothetical protein
MVARTESTLICATSSLAAVSVRHPASLPAFFISSASRGGTENIEAPARVYPRYSPSASTTMSALRIPLQIVFLLSVG